MVLDVNVLVALFRQDHPHHQLVSQWWRAAEASGTTITAPDVVWTGVVRIITNARIFPVPADIDEAFAFVDAVMAQPTYLPAHSVPEVIPELERVCRESLASGDLVPDAYIAAFARRLGASVVTFDRDFRRFDGVGLVELR